jgi:hypothetical protein
LGRAEARSKLWEESYEHLRLCVELYPDDSDLAESKTNFRGLRDEVRKELTYEQAKPIDERVEADVKRREEDAEAAAAVAEPPEAPAVESGLDGEPQTKKSSARLPVSLILGGVGVAGVGVGTAFLIVSGNQRSSADELRGELEGDGLVCVGDNLDGRCTELSDKSKSADTTRTVGVVGLAAGGALLVGGVLTYLLWPESSGTAASSATNHARIIPDVRNTAAGGWTLGVQGSF